MLASSFGSCCTGIYDNNENCPTTLHIGFYNRTMCASDTTWLGDVKQLNLMVFDDNNRLFAATSLPQANLNQQFRIDLRVPQGAYSLVAWAGMNKNFWVADLAKGKTKREDLFIKLNASANNQAPLLGDNLWFGFTNTPVVMPSPAEFGAIEKEVMLNMQQKNYHLKVTVELDASITDKIKPNDIAVAITSANGAYRIDGSMPLDNPILNYPSNISYDGNMLMANYELLDLRTGYHNTITLTDIKNNKVIYTGDLLGNILQDTENVNLDCEHNLTVKFLLKDKCADCKTFQAVCIWVNNWIIHSYETDLGRH